MRGFVGKSLTPNVILDYGLAFATFVKGGRVIIGRDTRYSSPMIHAAVVASLLSAGCEVIDLGICPTPILQFSTKLHQAAGAISITGGHNSVGWNALILIGPDGAFIEPLGGEEVLELFHASDFRKVDWSQMGKISERDDFLPPYLRALSKQVQIDKIRAANLTVLIDPVGGAGCSYLEPFAQCLGFNLVPVNARPSGYLAREPEPRPRSALQMASFINFAKGDVGFVLSSDMGRLSIVTEDGEPASEEYTLALIAQHLLQKQTGTVVTNCCTTRSLDDICAAKKATLVKTRVGQAFVISTLEDELGILGGEGSGSAALLDFSPAFDGFLMMALLLDAMAESSCKMSDLLGQIPRYQIVKRHITLGTQESYQALERAKDHLCKGPSNATIDLTDGIRADWPDGWLHVRRSHTQQIVRIISEATTREVADARADDIIRVLAY